MRRWLTIAGLAIGCGGHAVPDGAPAVSRAEHNGLAMRENLGWFWTADGAVPLAFYPPVSLDDAEARIAAAADARPADERTAKVWRDLGGGHPRLILTHVAPEERPFVDAMVEASELVHALFLEQNGAAAIADRVAPDAASQSLFRRNRGARCATRGLETDPGCTAIAGGAAQPVAVYPVAVQAEDGFCATLEARSDAALLAPFTVVRDDLTAAPYTEAWPDEMAAIAEALDRAAEALAGPAEAAQAAYLRAAASGFRTNDWPAADRAWADAGHSGSAWYVRVAPDEVGWDPCAQKAGFHLTFGRRNTAAEAWQDRFAPRLQEIEGVIAELAGPPYERREVAFALPEFVDIVVNAGDDRDPLGATLGQSLPNWGTDSGLSRTFAAANVYTDADSVAEGLAQARALLDDASVAPLVDAGADPALVSTLLHEMMHNLGPSSSGEDAFGGELAYLAEELKAQTGALFLARALDLELAPAILVDGLNWCFGFIAHGMYEPGGAGRPYGQLCAIQIGTLIDAGAMTWRDDRFHLDLARSDDAIATLTRDVLGIRARGDRAALEALIARYVDGDHAPPAVIAERAGLTPDATFVYAIVAD